MRSQIFRKSHQKKEKKEKFSLFFQKSDQKPKFKAFKSIWNLKGLDYFLG